MVYQEIVDLVSSQINCRTSEVFLLRIMGNQQKELVASSGSSEEFQISLFQELEESNKIVYVKDNDFILGFLCEESHEHNDKDKKLIEKSLQLIKSFSKPLETNRFLRHEIKNGILSCLIECDRVRNEFVKEDDGISDDYTPPLSAPINFLPHCCSPTQGLLNTGHLDETLFAIDTAPEKLNNTLKLLMSSNMITNILAGTYEPEMKLIDLVVLAKTCCGIVGSSYSSIKNQNRIVVQSNSDTPYLYLETDYILLKYILENAISNACKYGSRTKPILINISTCDHDDTSTRVYITIKNSPGLEGHDALLALENPNIIFEAGTRFHNTKNNTDSRRFSAGDGAWIMKTCAQALRGTCSIEFRPNQTCFTTIFDARRPPKVMSTHSILNLRIDTTTSNTITYKEQTIFRPPQDTTFICGIDDSASQRYWLTTAFEKLGYQTKIWGQYASDLDSFVSDACALISTYSYHRFIFFIDRHLHYPSSQCTQVSGIQLGSNLMLQLKKLGLLHRSLILLRSADDDAPLNSNLHGFISKDILSADRCLYAILPFWNNHFTS